MLSRNSILGFAVLCFKASYSLPLIKFPIDAQLPPVAVVGQPFSFTFSPETFSSALEISYTAKDLPVWLRFEASGRTLIGTPTPNDVGRSRLELEATDSEGNVVVHLDLVVLAKGSVKADQDLFAKQFSKSGSYSSPNTMLLSPETPFDLDIGPGVFESDDNSIYFYATSENHTPLPAWIHFDEGAVKFSGTTPSLLTPQSSPQTFNFSLLASQVPRFSQSVISFQISVTNHILAFVDPIQNFKFSTGDSISIPPLIEQLHLDTKPITQDQIAKISTNQPDWLILRSSDLSFYGSAPEGTNNTAFRLEVDDMFNNVANVDVHLQISAFDTMKPQEIYLGVENISIGQQFNYTFADITSRAVDVEIDLGLADSWLRVERTNASVHGVVPSNIGDSVLNISAIVRQDGQIVRLEYLTLEVNDILSNATSGSSGNETAVSQPTSTQTQRSTAEPDNNSGKGLLALFITIPIIIFLFVSLVIGFIVKRSRQRRTRNTVVSSSMRESWQTSSSGNVAVRAEDESHTEIENGYQHPSLAPQVSIHWAQDRPPTRRPGSVLHTGSTDISCDRSSWDDMLVEVGHPRGQTIGGRHRGHDAGSVAIVDADADRSSSPSIPLQPLTSRKITLRTPLHANPSSTPRFEGRRTGGLGHGNSLTSPIMDLQRATLRSVPLSPLSESSPVMSSMVGADSALRSLASKNLVLPETGASSSAFSGRNVTRKVSSSSSSGSGYEVFKEDQPSRAYKHLRRRTASTPFSGSLWEDEEWMTEDSASKSGNWHTQGMLYSTSQVPTDLSLEDNMVRQWNTEPHSIIAPVSSTTSMRSQRSQQSQTNSLRFI